MIVGVDCPVMPATESEQTIKEEVAERFIIKKKYQWKWKYKAGKHR